MRAWGLPVSWVDPVAATADDCRAALAGLAAADGPRVLLWGE